jgi:hypothetical protein
MKPSYTFVFFAVLLACTPQSQTDNSNTESTKTVVTDTVLKSVVDKVDVPAVTEPVRQTVPEAKQEKKDPSKKTLRCVYQTYEAGDCPHIIFDCADFGSANTTSLPANQAKVWNDLLAFDGHGDFPMANENYVGKTFEIVHDYVDVASCNASTTGESAMVKVPNILSFKLIAN